MVTDIKQITKDLEYLQCFPFLSNSKAVLDTVGFNLNKIENMNVFDGVLFSIFVELNKFLEKGSIPITVAGYPYEVSKFYLSIIVLRYLDNIAITRIWVKEFQKRVRYYFNLILHNKPQHEQIKIVTDIFRLLGDDNQFELKQITIEGTIAYGLRLMEYLDVAAEVQNSDDVRYKYLKLVNVTLKKGYVIIPLNDIDFLSSFIEYYVKLHIFKMYESIDMNIISVSKKIGLMVEKLKEQIKKSNASINIKKHTIPKELLYEQERIKDVEQSNVIMNQIEQTNKVNVDQFPPCINVLLDKIQNQKIPLSHYENILLCTYLGKKQFIKEHIIKIFSKAVNYDKKITDYQVEALLDKQMMPMSCSNLGTEGLCKMNLDKTNQCGHIKNPLTFR